VPDPSRVVIWACWFVLAVVWIIAGLFTKRTVEHAQGAWHSTLLVRACLIAVIVLASTAGGVGGRLWAPGPFVGWLSAVLVATGLAFALWARAELGRNWSASVVLKEGQRLVCSGPYAIVRHPIYTGLIAMALGTACDGRTAAGIGLVCALSAALWAKSRREERLMAAAFPAEYPGYRRRVRAFVPYVV
jgi:protein-S-isoprenylcysteine O-methyltransferase Ste14